MQKTGFVTVVQRRSISVDEAVFALIEPLFAIETHMSMEERAALLTVASGLEPGFVACEIGSYVGASANFIAAAASLNGGHLHCVDTWDNRAMGTERPRDTYLEFVRNTARFREFITAHRGVSTEMATHVPAQLALLLLDGDHDYESVKTDLATYAPRLKPGGVLLLHDFDYDSVQRACREHLHDRNAIDLGRTDNLQGFRL